MAEEATKEFNARLFNYIGGEKGEAAGYLVGRDESREATTQVALKATAMLDSYARTEEGKALRGLLASASEDEFLAAKRSDKVQAYITEALDESFQQYSKAKQAEVAKEIRDIPVEIRAIPLIKEKLTDYTDPLSPYCDKLKPVGQSVNGDGSKSHNYDATMVFHGDGGQSISHIRVSLVQGKDGKFTAYQSDAYKVEYIDQDGKEAYKAKTDPDAGKRHSFIGDLKQVSPEKLNEMIADKNQRDRENEPVKVTPQIGLEQTKEIGESYGR